MDQKLVADILQAEIQVGRKIKQNQNNLKQFSEFNPEHAFETLKKFYINSYNLNGQSQQLQNSMSQTKFANVPGSAYKGVVDIEKLTLLYRQYEETVSSFEIQAILSRHSAASDKGMDYDCFLKFIGFNLGDTKRKNTIFDSQARTERSLTERCMKALSSIFLLELDLLRFTEVHKVSLINNYGFDSASFFAQIDYRSQSQIDFELLQQFFRRNGQEISLQDYQILLSRLKRNKQSENQFINRQEFIQLISPQLPYRGKNWQGQSVLFQSQAGQKSQVLGANEKTVRFQDQSVVHTINQNSNVLAQSQNVNLINQQQSKILTGGNVRSQIPQDAVGANYIQNGTLGLTQRYEQNNYAFNQIDQNQQQQQPLFNQLSSTTLYQQPQQLSQQLPQSIIQQQPVLVSQPLSQSHPIFMQNSPFASQMNPSVIGSQQVVQGQVGLPLIPGQQQSLIIGEIPPPPPGYALVQNPPQTVLLPQPIQQQGFDPQYNNTAFQQQQFQHQQEPQYDNKLLNEKRPNAVLEAMNQILQKDNDKLKRDNNELLQKVLKYEQYQQREIEEEQKRQREAEQKRLQLQQEQEEQQRKQQLLQLQQQQAQLSHFIKFPTHVTFSVPSNQINQPGVGLQSVPLNHQVIQSPVQSQIITSPPMSPIRVVPAANQPPEIQQRDSVIAQQLISSQPPQPQAPTYILDPKQVPTYVVNDQQFIVNQLPTSQFTPNLLPKYNPQNLEIREAINQQFLPPLPFIQQGFSTHSKNQPIQDPYNGQAVTSHYPNRLNY